MLPLKILMKIYYYIRIFSGQYAEFFLGNINWGSIDKCLGGGWEGGVNMR